MSQLCLVTARNLKQLASKRCSRYLLSRNNNQESSSQPYRNLRIPHTLIRLLWCKNHRLSIIPVFSVLSQTQNQCSWMKTFKYRHYPKGNLKIRNKKRFTHNPEILRMPMVIAGALNQMVVTRHSSLTGSHFQILMIHVLIAEWCKKTQKQNYLSNKRQSRKIFGIAFCTQMYLMSKCCSLQKSTVSVVPT